MLRRYRYANAANEVSSKTDNNTLRHAPRIRRERNCSRRECQGSLVRGVSESIRVGLAFHQALQRREEVRIGNGHAIRVPDDGRTFGSKRSHGESHGHAMVVMRIEISSV